MDTIMNSTLKTIGIITFIESLLCATTVLNTLHLLTLLILKTHFYEICNIIIPIF